MNNRVTLSLVFMAGVILGHFHRGARHMIDTMTRLDKTAAVASPRKRHDGWNSIDVFFGAKDTFESTLPQHFEWFSQVGQDQVVMSLLRNKTGGYFVDLAANDATNRSNTYVLEKRFGWNGLCIEPNPIYWENLAYRDCQVVAAVVGNASMEQVHFRLNAGIYGGIVGSGFDNGPQFKSTSFPRYTVTLEEILTRYHAPHQIDYLSLDVEGAEEFIMNNFPFHKYHISIMTTERPSGPLKEVFKRNGFRELVRMSNFGEIMWAHESVWDSLDMSVLDRIEEIQAEIKAAYAKFAKNQK